MIRQFLSWYLVIQLITLLALPLCVRLFRYLPDRGYAFAKSLGVLLVSLILWLGTSYGLMRNDTGGAWFALFIVAMISLLLGRRLVWPVVSPPNDEQDASIFKRIQNALPSRGYVLVAEGIFLAAFIAWAYVRAHDPAADHTEQPMDLMFMNGIWHSATYPPRDPWLAGYAISYYYFGYWILTTLARLAGLTPAVAYNVGQACWLGLLLLGSFGLAYNLVALASSSQPGILDSKTRGSNISAYLGGLLGSIAVGLTGNLMAPLEWLYANGVKLELLTKWLDIYNFPENASVTNNWFIGSPWWWWRSARVIEDLDLSGNHIEVIDEFPMFSYVLGDNHPHVLAMPFAILAIALALNMLARLGWHKVIAGESGSHSHRGLFGQLLGAIPLGPFGLFLMIAVSGGLIFLNTWDFPPYGLLLVLCMLAALWCRSADDAEADMVSSSSRWGRVFVGTITFGLILLAGAIALYLPYFLTAQSQAGGVLPNLFYPTHFPQFLIMFGGFLPPLCLLIWLAWRERPADLGKLVTSAILVFGLPLLWLAVSIVGAPRFAPGRVALERVLLPPAFESHTAAMLERWTTQSATFLVLGLLLSLTVALSWTWLKHLKPTSDSTPAVNIATFFVLLLATVGLLLVYAPRIHLSAR